MKSINNKKEKMPEDYNYEYDLQYNTSINKKMFEFEICKRLNNEKNINCYYNAKTGKLVVIDKKSKEKISAPFYEFISGVSRFDINYENNNGNYKLKESIFPESGIKSRFILFDVFNFKLNEIIKDYTGINNKVKMSFDNLFDSNLLITKPKSNVDFQISQALKNNVYDRNKAGVRANYEYNLFYKYYIQFEPSPDKNPFDALDVIAKYAHCSFYVYYPETKDCDPIKNGTYETLLNMIPRIVLVDNKNNRILYEGESISFLTSTLLEKFNEDVKYSAQIKREMNTAKKLNNVFEKMMVFDYVSEQLDQIKLYLKLRKNDISEEKNLKNLDSLVTKTKGVLYDSYDKISTNKVALEMEDVLNVMIDEFDELREQVGYFDQEIINNIVEKHSNEIGLVKEKIKNSEKKIENNIHELQLELDFEM